MYDEITPVYPFSIIKSVNCDGFSLIWAMKCFSEVVISGEESFWSRDSKISKTDLWKNHGAGLPCDKLIAANWPAVRKVPSWTYDLESKGLPSLKTTCLKSVITFVRNSFLRAPVLIPDSPTNLIFKSCVAEFYLHPRWNSDILRPKPAPLHTLSSNTFLVSTFCWSSLMISSVEENLFKCLFVPMPWGTEDLFVDNWELTFMLSMLLILAEDSS